MAQWWPLRNALPSSRPKKNVTLMTDVDPFLVDVPLPSNDWIWEIKENIFQQEAIINMEPNFSGSMLKFDRVRCKNLPKRHRIYSLVWTWVPNPFLLNRLAIKKTLQGYVSILDTPRITQISCSWFTPIISHVYIYIYMPVLNQFYAQLYANYMPIVSHDVGNAKTLNLPFWGWFTLYTPHEKNSDDLRMVYG